MRKLNQILISWILLSIPIQAFAQPELNAFLRKAEFWEISTNGQERFEEVFNMYAANVGPKLYFSFTKKWKGYDGDSNYTKYKITINLGRSSIYNGYWSHQGGKYVQIGDKSIVTIKQNSIQYELNHSFENKSHTGNLVRNEILIDCITEENAVRLVTLLTALQKEYREPYPWTATMQDSPITYSNKSSKEIYEQLAKDFKSFEIISRDVFYHSTASAYTTDVGITFSFPHIIITYSDKWKEGVVSSVIKPGKYTIKIPVNHCDFSSTKSYTMNTLVFTSTQGIEIYYNNKLRLEPRFELMISGLGAERICIELKQFKTTVLSEGYIGSYGISDKPMTKNNTQTQKKPKSILNKYEE